MVFLSRKVRTVANSRIYTAPGLYVGLLTSLLLLFDLDNWDDGRSDLTEITAGAASGRVARRALTTCFSEETGTDL